MQLRGFRDWRLEGARWRFGFALWLLLLAGCPAAAPPPAPKSLPLAGVRLKLLVVDDPAIAAAIQKLRNEWKAVSGGELEVAEASRKAIVGDLVPKCDAIIYPSASLGTLAERGVLAIAPQEILEGEEFAWSQEFELLQTHEAMWGGDVLALPMGSPVFTLMYRADVLESLGKSPPRTWAEYQVLVDLLHTASGKKLPEELAHGLEPLGPGWAGRLLLARAACYAKHRENFSALFHINSMEPLVDGPPFVRALEELLASAKLNDVNMTPDPTVARKELLEGRAAMAITWPTAAKSLTEATALPANARIAFAELPGSEQVFNVSTQAWEAHSDGAVATVPLVSIAGRVGSVWQKCEYPEGAFRLLAWLSGPQWSARVSAVSPHTTLFRNSHFKSPNEWVDPQIDSTAAINYAEVVQQSLVRSNGLSVPRIPGEAEYMAALDKAVSASLAGEASPVEALVAARQSWTEITERHGTDKQRRAYQRSLGLNP